MIKLDNKGFAVSTILYGILSLTILILMLIFGVMKSSKDMNQDLVESIENKMNECVLSETKLESCYFNGGVCDAYEYNTCIGKKVEVKSLHEVVEVGDFVNYDAGIWNSTTSYSSVNNSFEGHESGVSRNNNSSCASGPQYNGWRVLSVSDSTVKLIHAGIPECFYTVSNSSYPNSQYNYEQIMTGQTTGTVNSTIDSTPKDWSIYVNSDYATKAKLLDIEEVNMWYKQANNTTNSLGTYVSVFDDLINVGSDYFLADIYGGAPYYLMYYGSTEGTKLVYYGSGKKGIRPVVTLKENIKTSGSVTNTYGKKEWLLVK